MDSLTQVECAGKRRFRTIQGTYRQASRSFFEVEYALESRSLVLPPVVLSELLSDPALDGNLRHSLLAMPLLPVLDGYWQRVGHARATILAQKIRARLADALIAQSCIDSNIALITRDVDFRHFERFCKLNIAG